MASLNDFEARMAILDALTDREAQEFLFVCRVCNRILDRPLYCPCRSEVYCGKECQRVHWRMKHKADKCVPLAGDVSKRVVLFLRKALHKVWEHKGKSVVGLVFPDGDFDEDQELWFTVDEIRDNEELKRAEADTSALRPGWVKIFRTLERDMPETQCVALITPTINPPAFVFPLAVAVNPAHLNAQLAGTDRQVFVRQRGLEPGDETVQRAAARRDSFARKHMQ
jgi:hypothetical protein